ncbi:NAD(P)-binding domain-containing protein [Allokutzneria sp. A3M-2-11 16]|uniref:NAD(P)-dependent oxidoreductase n=1 Tax=Allokutzneria sp. A3M-2-11 16 TaxID=2962043 RepID=UPI0020B71665|nr:NAD(P)-binding domain-containing protein [Allokutzneria sp. A3M-2-11 16]MCP3803895.1 NAD(P)-binding domain-containing protein [Allokutzneria sp. A3M-2-11 16]
MDTNNVPVTVIGLGSMGKALAAAFLKAGHPTTVWNRTAGKADDLVANGAVRAATVEDAISASPLVVICLLDYPTLHDVLGGAGAALAGRTVVNLTNGTPDQARETAAWAAEIGADYLDGGIMAVPPMIGQPGSLVLYSGSRSSFDQHARALDGLGAAQFVGADPGLASLYDLALLSAMYGQFSGVSHALALVGPDHAEALSALLPSWLSATAGLSATGGDDSDSPSDMQAVAIGNISAASTAQGVHPDLLGHLLIPLRALLGPRAADQDFPTLITLLHPPTQPT